MKDIEKIIVYTRDKEPICAISRKYYEKIDKLRFKGKFFEPWVECVTCFIINPKDNTVAIQLRSSDETDANEYNLCSGYVRKEEINIISMMRELQEEMAMDGYANSELADKLLFCGKVKMDFSKIPNNKSKNLRCFASVYSILVDDIKCVRPNEASVSKVRWMEYETLKNAIRTSMFRFPYTKENEEQYEKVFKNIDKIIYDKKFVMSEQEYLENWK